MVVGAGVAGLAAAATLRDLRIPCIVIEAAARIGGRAWTTHPPELGGAPFDHGAVWLHDADRNPLTAIAREAGETLTDTAAHRSRRTWLGDRYATTQERGALDRAWAAYDEAGARLAAAPGPDSAMTAVADALAGGEDAAWMPMIEAWEGPVICAAEAHDISLRDWHANALEGRNLMFPGGLGDFVTRRLGPLAGEVRCAAPATAIAWSGRGVTVTTPLGAIEGCAAVVTVSTAVLARGAIRFTPALPAPVLQAASDLPLGLAVKVALRAAGSDRLGLPPFSTLDRRIVARSDAFVVFNFWPYGRDHAIAWIGGDAARALSRAGARAAQDFALAEINRMLGSTAAALFADEAIVTGWGRDPLIGGVYSNARPGAADARRTLATPLADGRLVFAGEACHVGFAGTVAGAWLSGVSAARHVAAALPPQPTVHSRPSPPP